MDNLQVMVSQEIALVEMLERTQVLVAVPVCMVVEVPPLLVVKVEVVL